MGSASNAPHEHVADLVTALRLPTDPKTLLLSGGDSQLASLLADRGAHVTSIAPRAADQSPPFGQQRRPSNGSNVCVNVRDFDDLCVADESFDCVVAVGAIEHARWQRLLLRRLFCSLKPGGFLVTTTPALHPTSPEQPANRVATNPCHQAREFDHLLRKIGFDMHTTGRRRVGSWLIGRLTMPHRLSSAIEWGLERVNRGIPEALRRNHDPAVLVIGQKPPGATVSARLDTTPTLHRGIEWFPESYRSEFDRLATWQQHFADQQRPPDPSTANRRLQECTSAMVLSPHPDDELIGCGGVVLGMIERGARVTVIQMTDGADSAALQDADERIKRTVRCEEARRVAGDMGVTDLLCFNVANSALTDSPDVVAKLRDAMTNRQPQVVFVPFINDSHVDHVAANHILERALEGMPRSYQPLILSYEVWSLTPNHLVVPIDRFVGRKLDLLMGYPTPMRVVDYIWHCQVRDGHHSRAYLNRDGYAESFLALERDQYVRLIQHHRRIPRQPDVFPPT